MLYRKGRILHQEPNKIRFAFFWFFYDFLQIFEVAAENPNTHLHRDPQLKSPIHESVPALHKTPCIKPNPWLRSPGRTGPHRRPEFPAGDARTWPEEVPRVPRALTRVDLRRNPGRTCHRWAPTAWRRRCARQRLARRRPLASMRGNGGRDSCRRAWGVAMSGVCVAGARGGGSYGRRRLGLYPAGAPRVHENKTGQDGEGRWTCARPQGP
jgi:hypothetical protein